MDNETLVNSEIENGKRVIDALDKAGKSPEVALWARFPEYETWRLVLSSSRLRDYRELLHAMIRGGFQRGKEPAIYLRDFDSPFVRDLRTNYAGMENFGRHIGSRYFGGQYVEDAFVYRIQ